MYKLVACSEDIIPGLYILPVYRILNCLCNQDNTLLATKFRAEFSPKHVFRGHTDTTKIQNSGLEKVLTRCFNIDASASLGVCTFPSLDHCRENELVEKFLRRGVLSCVLDWYTVRTLDLAAALM